MHVIVEVSRSFDVQTMTAGSQLGQRFPNSSVSDVEIAFKTGLIFQLTIEFKLRRAGQGNIPRYIEFVSQNLLHCRAACSNFEVCCPSYPMQIES